MDEVVDGHIVVEVRSLLLLKFSSKFRFVGGGGQEKVVVWKVTTRMRKRR